jgi:hypothetical protein
MIVQIPPDPGKRGVHGDTEAVQLIGRTDTGARQDRRSAVGSSGENNPVGGEAFSALDQSNADRAAVLDDYSVNCCRGPDRYVRAVSGAHQVGERGRLPDTADFVDRQGRRRPRPARCDRRSTAGR